MKTKKLELIKIDSESILVNKRWYYEKDNTNNYINLDIKILEENIFLIKELKDSFILDYKEVIKRQIEGRVVKHNGEIQEIEDSIKFCTTITNKIQHYIDNEYQELKKNSIAELSKKLLELENL